MSTGVVGSQLQEQLSEHRLRVCAGVQSQTVKEEVNLQRKQSSARRSERDVTPPVSPVDRPAGCSDGLKNSRDPIRCVSMNSTSKFVTSAAIKAEIKRHESLQSAVNRLAKQFERVADQQLRSGMKDYLHSIQGEPVDLRGPRGGLDPVAETQLCSGCH